MKTEWCVACKVTKNLHHHHLVPSAAGGTDTDDNIITLCGEHHAAVHGNFSKWTTSELVKKAFDEKRERGEAIGSPPYGFKTVEKKLVPCEEEQRILDLAKRLRATGLTYQAVSDHLSALGYTNRKGNSFHKKSVHNLVN